MKKERKAKEQAAPTPAKAAPKQEPVSLGSLGFRNLTPLCDGAAALTITSTTIDGRYDGFICSPDGDRLERVRLADIAEAEARAKQLVDKGAL